MNASLTARPRAERGKNAARALRRDGRVPGVVYGHGEESRPISVDSHELEKLLHSISVDNTVIELRIDEGAPLNALIREVQWHPFKPTVLHVDLMQLHAGEKLRLNVPVRLLGSAPGVHGEGGVLDQVLYDLEVECLPRDIPEAADVDVSAMQIGDVLRVRDVHIPNVKILNDEDLAIVSVHPPTVQALEEEPIGEEGVGGEVEPELVRKPRAAAETEEEAEE